MRRRYVVNQRNGQANECQMMQITVNYHNDRYMQRVQMPILSKQFLIYLLGNFANLWGIILLLDSSSTIFYHCIINMLIEVQHCIDCHLHNWCSRHNEAKYHEFYHKLQAKIKSIDRHAKIHKNQIPHHYHEKNAANGSPQPAHRYYDQQRNEDVVFPRHGAFEVKVNGVLIFSKLQSNLWPNLQKITSIMAQIRSEVEAGRDIHKFSLDYRLENNNKEDEKFVDTYKRVIKFKINKRPHSSQFNASAYLPKGSLEQTPETKYSNLKRKNVTSLKKAGYDLHRKSDVARKPLIRFRNSKVQQNNLYNQFQEPKDNEERSQPSEVGKIVKNQFASPHSKKKIQFKNEVLHPIKAQPFEIIPNNSNNSSSLKLQKKPSRKLIIKANDKKSDLFSQASSKFGENVQEPMDASDKVIMNHNPVFFTNISTKKSLKSVISIGDKLQNKEDKLNRRAFNQIKVEDYFTEKQIDNNKVNTQKQIQKNKSDDEVVQRMQTSSVQPLQSIHIEETPQVKKEPTQKLVSQYDVNQFEESPEELENGSKKTVKSQQIQEKEVQKEEKQQRIEQQEKKVELEQQVRLPSEKRDTQKSNSNYEEQLYDNYEIQQQQEEEARPPTSSSRRMLNEQIKREEEILEYQEVVEGNFKKKGNTTAQKLKEEDFYEEEFPAEETEEVPVVAKHCQQQTEEEEKKAQTVLSGEEAKPVEERQEEVKNEVQPTSHPQAQTELKEYKVQPFERKQLIYEFDEEEEVENSPLQNKQKQQIVSKNEEVVIEAQQKIVQPKQQQLSKNEKENIQSEHLIAKQPVISLQEQPSEEVQVEAVTEKQVKDQIQVEQSASNHQLVQSPLNQPEIVQQQPKQIEEQALQSNLQPQMTEPVHQNQQSQANIQQEHAQNIEDHLQPETVQECQYEQARQQEKHEKLPMNEQAPIEEPEKEQKVLSQGASPANQNVFEQQQEEKLLAKSQIDQTPLPEKDNQQIALQQQQIETKQQEIVKQQVDIAKQQEDKIEQIPQQNTQSKQEDNLHQQDQNHSQMETHQQQHQQVQQAHHQQPKPQPISQPYPQTQTEKQQQPLKYKLTQPHSQSQTQLQQQQRQQQEPRPQTSSQGQPQKQQQQQPQPQQVQQQLQECKQEENIVPLNQPAEEPKEQVEYPPQQESPSHPSPKSQQQNQQLPREQSAVDVALAKRQSNLPSIHHIASVQSARGPQTLRSIPNVTQTTITLTSQIHSELNNVYEQIEARIDARISVASQQ